MACSAPADYASIIPTRFGASLLGLIHIAAFFFKVALLLFFFIWVRWTLPRFRYDQLMRLGWYFFIEIALVNVFHRRNHSAFHCENEKSNVMAYTVAVQN